MVLILCGKSCTGKDTIKRNLVNYYNFTPLITLTTRPKRDNEIDGVDYNFISLSELENLAHNGRIIEYRKFNTLVNGKEGTWFYATPLYHLEDLEDYVIILDPRGARKFIDYHGKDNCCLLCIESDEISRLNRAKQRPNFDQTEWDRRLETDSKDFGYFELYDIVYSYILNDLPIDLCVEKVLDFYSEWKDKK